MDRLKIVVVSFLVLLAPVASAWVGCQEQPTPTPRPTATPTASPYSYGSDSDSGVVAHWKFQESASPVVDSKNSISLPNVNTTGATYGQTGTGLWSSFSGVMMTDPPPPGNEGYWANFSTASAVTQLNVASGQDMVIEWVEQLNTGTWPWSGGGSGVMRWNNSSIGAGYSLAISRYDATHLYCDVYTDGGAHEWWKNWEIPAANDGATHKYRIAFRRSSTMELFVDGVSMGTEAIAGPTDTITNTDGIEIGHAGYRLHGIIREMRITIGNPTNNSGGPGGG